MSNDASNRPVIGITMGDASGIGPEIIVRSLNDEQLRSGCACVVIGDLRVLSETAERLGLQVGLSPYAADIEPRPGSVPVIDLHNLPDMIEVGVDRAVTGRASAEYIETAVELWREGRIDAICTAPISKKAIAMGGYDFPGHTEFLAHLTGTGQFAMSFFADRLRVVLLSTHLPLLEAARLVKRDALIELIRFTHKELSSMLGRNVSIAVAGFNPHASEGGLFGSEEHDEIIPAIDHCTSLGINVSGPYSADTVFLRGFRGEFDVCVALYHDQGTIPVKTLSFGAAVNVTLGLPLIRTSVDHGTAYDIAGTGTADASSMMAAIKLAGELAVIRNRSE